MRAEVVFGAVLSHGQPRPLWNACLGALVHDSVTLTDVSSQ